VSIFIHFKLCFKSLYMVYHITFYSFLELMCDFMDISYFVHQLMNTWVLYILAIVNNAAMNIHFQVSDGH
jgi:hypothetical protein